MPDETRSSSSIIASLECEAVRSNVMSFCRRPVVLAIDDFRSQIVVET